MPHCNLNQSALSGTFIISLQLIDKWRCGPDMPFELSDIQSVLVQDTLYVGGRGVADSENNDYIVMTYGVSTGIWATLSPYSTRYYAMTAIDNHLVLVGGEWHNGHRSNMLGVWSEDKKRWTHPYPDMATPRSSCSAVTYEEWLIVAGGNGDGNESLSFDESLSLSSVEIINTVTKQWYAGPPTPIAWEDMKTVTVGVMCYFMGGWTEEFEGSLTSNVYGVSLPVLISQLDSDSSAKDTQTWKELPQLPVTRAAPLAISGSLLAVGGFNEDDITVSTLHLYQPDAGKWVKVADMPTPRCDCTCVMTSNDELLVAGGYSAIETNDWLKTLDFAQVHFLFN